MMARSLLYRLLVLLAAAVLLSPVLASAQANPIQAYINDVIEPQEIPTKPGQSAFSYEVDLTLLDPQQNVVSSAGVVTATLALTPGGSYPAQVQKLEAPWTMVVLIDASSTVGVYSAGADYTLLRTQLAAAIGSLPEGYNVQVEKFDQTPATLLDFTNAKDKIANAIQKGFQSTTSGSACLNDAVNDAINNLSRAPGRRALLVVTASLDSCGKPAEQALALAKQNHIQVYAVGMLGYKVDDAKSLAYLTAPTGGLAYAREPKDLKFALLNVTQALSLQWATKATFYHSAGPVTATVQLTLSDQTLISTQQLFFTLNKGIDPPPQINLRGAVQSTKQGIHFGLDFVSPRLINQLKLNVTSKVTGDSINQQTVSQIQDTYDLPINNLTAGSSYVLQITALDKTGAQVSQAESEFQYQPPQGQLKVTQVLTPTQQQPEFVLQVSETDLDGVVKHKAWLQTDGQTDVINVTELPVGTKISVPVTNLKTGVYEVVVQALDASNAVMAQAVSDKQTYTAPSSLDLAAAWLAANPAALLGLGAIGCLAMVSLLVGVVIILPRPRGQPKAPDFFVPDVRRRQAPGDLEASKSQPVPPPAVARPNPAPQANAVRAAPLPPASVVSNRPAAAPAGMPKACLSGYAPAELRVAVTITKPSYTIGRRDGNDLVLSVDNKVGVSGRHATIKFVDGRFFIVDDKSTFGTFINDQHLPAGATMPLDDGAIIGLGPKVKIQFRLNCP